MLSADEMIFSHRAGEIVAAEQQMGGLRAPDPPEAGPLNQLKDHQSTLNHTSRSFREGGAL